MLRKDQHLNFFEHGKEIIIDDKEKYSNRNLQSVKPSKKPKNIFNLNIKNLIGANINEKKINTGLILTKKIGDNIFDKFNFQALNNFGDFMTFEKYEEKLLNHYAGLSYKIEASDDKLNLPTQDYLSYDWHYVLVFPNPDYEKSEKFCNMQETERLYDTLFFPDTTKRTFLKGQSSEKKVFDFVIKNKINDNINNTCLINKGGCFQKSKHI